MASETALRERVVFLENRLKYAESALQVSIHLNAARDEDELLATLAKPAIDAGVNQAALYYITLDMVGEPEWLELGAIWQRTGEPVETKGDRYRIAEYAFIQLWLKHPDAPFIVSDIMQDDRIDESTRTVFRASGHNATAVLPLRQGGRWVGCLVLSWQDTHVCSEQELDLYQIMCGIGTAAVENQRLLIRQKRWQAQIIEQQREMLKQLSTPIIPLVEGIVLLPLIGSIDSDRAQDILRTLLSYITTSAAKIVILDVTGVDVIDTQVAQHLEKTIQAARLKGAATIMTGISEHIAETVVDLGIVWQVDSVRDLQTGLKLALSRLGLRLI